MKYYKFHIGDYQSHTGHLEPLEDIAFRRMIDWQYLHEKPLPLDVACICKAIRMRSHSDCIEYVLQEFFIETEEGYINPRVDHDIAAFREKSQKARLSALSRWGKDDDANAMRTHSECSQKECEGNANQLTNKPTNQQVRKQQALSLLDYLNEKAQSRFRAVESTVALIMARLGEDHDEEEIKAVIDAKVAEWGDDEKMKQYIRPKTLFNATNFNNYVGQSSPGGSSNKAYGEVWE